MVRLSRAKIEKRGHFCLPQAIAKKLENTAEHMYTVPADVLCHSGCSGNSSMRGVSAKSALSNTTDLLPFAEFDFRHAKSKYIRIGCTHRYPRGFHALPQ